RELPTENQLRSFLVRRLLPDKHTRFFIAADSGADCIGYVQQRYRFSLWTQGPQADIEDLFVMPAARRQGVGASLIQFAIDQPRSFGCPQISVDTNEEKSQAMALYANYGSS